MHLIVIERQNKSKKKGLTDHEVILRLRERKSTEHGDMSPIVFEEKKIDTLSFLLKE